MILILLIITVVGIVYGRPSFRDEFPNGYSVPNMCYGIYGGKIWEPVGHYNPSNHTRDKNPFGLDFAAANRIWSRSLCIQDSDRDGKTNGEELGDPHCTWTKGGPAPALNATGHPGICEPIGSHACASQVFFCGCQDSACVTKA